jgi:hypothetical protein
MTVSSTHNYTCCVLHLTFQHKAESCDVLRRAQLLAYAFHASVLQLVHSHIAYLVAALCMRRVSIGFCFEATVQ